MLMLFIIEALAVFSLVYTTGILPMFLGLALVGFCFGGNLSVFPPTTADSFGTKYYGLIYGFVFTAYGVGGILGSYLGGYTFDLFKSYTLAFQMAGVLCVIAFIISLILRSRK